jgi:hypothetical protein
MSTVSLQISLEDSSSFPIFPGNATVHESTVPCTPTEAAAYFPFLPPSFPLLHFPSLPSTFQLRLSFFQLKSVFYFTWSIPSPQLCAYLNVLVTVIVCVPLIPISTMALVEHNGGAPVDVTNHPQ